MEKRRKKKTNIWMETGKEKGTLVGRRMERKGGISSLPSDI